MPKTGVTGRLPYPLQSTAPTDGRCVRGVDLAWAVSAPEHRLADGTRFDDTLAAALNAFRQTGGRIRMRRLDADWVWFDEENLGQLASRDGAAIAALCRHALARAVARGLTEPYGLHDDPAGPRLGCHLAVADAAVVLMAALDKHLTDSETVLAWYLATGCGPRRCASHRDRPAPGPDRSAQLVLADLPLPCWSSHYGWALTGLPDWG